MGVKKRFGELLNEMRFSNTGNRRNISLKEQLYSAVLEQASLEEVPPEDLAAELLWSGLAKRRKQAELWERWQKLSGREQDVAALSCLGYTNRQIAAKLDIAADTVSWYSRNVQIRLAIHSKSELKLLFKGWDFSKWGPQAIE